MILQLGKLDVAVLLHERTAPQQLSRDLSEQRIERGWIFFEVNRFLMFEVSSMKKKKKVCFYFISVLSLPSVNFHKLIIALQFFASSVLINQVDLWPVNITGPWTVTCVEPRCETETFMSRCVCDPLQLYFPWAQPFFSQLTVQLLPTLVHLITVAIRQDSAHWFTTCNDFVAVWLGTQNI